ncbi:dynamin family protein [Brevibacillus panacihumi]|uniref:Dynamin-type G domain-containing protein n=1 Tax=Brevibacillus panacihumi TaxID=497735 RepID=A0A3M8CM88_9BACL|nr:dynamin family protein [Brevibacillus panacihumi]RNB76748.1 hypothetical protein EDM58_16755 [Brevibacillus panacihumi]
MNIEQITDKLVEISERLQHRAAINLLASIEDAGKRNTFHVAVLGEFNRGKSSLINAILGRTLLPTDVLPMTACLHVLEYGSEEACTIVWKNPPAETIPLTQEALRSLGADGEEDAAQIQFVVIRLNHPLLQNGLTLLDTPGVNDIEASRVEMTYQVLPHCDAAIFLLDAAAPLTKSEADFLQNKVLHYQIESLLFVLSKADRLDEEELEEAMEGASERIHQLLGQEAHLVPFSANRVWQERANYAESAEVNRLFDRIQVLREQAHQSFAKRQVSNLQLVCQMIEEQLAVEQTVLQLNHTKLVEYERALHSRRVELESAFTLLLASMDKVGRETLEQMFRASCARLEEKLVEDISYQLQIMEGDLEKFWNKNLPLQIERAIKQFAEEKAVEIKTYLDRFCQHVSSEYHRHFRTELLLTLGADSLQMPQWASASKGRGQHAVHQVMEQVLPVTIGMVAGNLILPGIGTIVGGALASVITTVVRGNQKEQMREALMEQVPDLVQGVITHYRREVEKTIEHWFVQMTATLESYHREQEEQLLATVQQHKDAASAPVPAFEQSELDRYRQTIEECEQMLMRGVQHV